jgi:hypothetical protein
MHAILIAGAALVGLPILLHLIMKQEPKRLSFPAFRFLTQKLKTNQRKLRLRHFILLALRMLLIAIFCLALYQPTMLSHRLSLVGDQPVATVIVLDTSPSMGYTANERTRFEEQRRRALELLDELPEKSPVAIIETDDLAAPRWMDKSEARKQIEKLDKPRGGSQPVTPAIGLAYQLLGKIEADVEEADQLPKLVAVFTDRTAASWDARVDDMKKLRETVPGQKPIHMLFDVGADHPTNVAILAAEMRPQVIAASQPANVVVTVAATGPATDPPVEATVIAKLDDEKDLRKQPVKIPYGQSRPLTFQFDKLKPGLHRVEFSLATSDRLMSDNTRFLTFRVGEARRVLAITDEPRAALFWRAGLLAAREPFGCLAVTPEQVKTDNTGRTKVEYPDPEKPDGKTVEDDIREFEVVCLLSVRDPSQKVGLDSLWDKLRPYVEGGGKLVIIPGDETLSVEGYAAGGNLMPGKLKKVISTKELDPPPPPQNAPGWGGMSRDGKNGVTWALSDQVIQHPMLRDFQGWRQKGNVDAVKYPRVTWKYWDVEKDPEATVIVKYDDAVKDADRHPAVLERGVAAQGDPKKMKGRVILLTTRLDTPTDDSSHWHDYWVTEGSTWFSVFPYLVVRYLAGDTADANFNFQTGQRFAVPLPKEGVPKGMKVVINGPGILGTDALMEVGDKQTELWIDRPRTNQPGNFELTVAPKWRDGFSLNVPADESTLEKVSVEAIEDLMGKDSVVPLDKNRNLRDAIVGGEHPIDLFPWLLIAVLLLLAVEGLVANRFYRRVK